jgi:hypothetical protein
MAQARMPSVDRDEPATGRVPSGDLEHHGLTIVPTGEIAREKMPHRSSEQAAELGRALLALAHEQTRHHLELLRALTDAVDWDNRTRMMDWEQILQQQGKVLQRSQARTAQLHQRYLELTRAVLDATATSRRSSHAA